MRYLWHLGLALALTMATLGASPSARAAGYGTVEAPTDDCCLGQFVLEADYRFRFNGMSRFALDDEGTRSRQRVWGEQRLRLDPWVSFADTVFLHAQLDAVTGQIFGDTSPIGADYLLRPRDEHEGLSSIDPRQLWLEWRAPFGRIAVGQMASSWGLGVVANGGERGDPRMRDVRFGDRYHGDIVERVSVAVPPAALFTKASWARSLFLVGSFDVVFRDENADLVDGDLAFQGSGALLYRTRPLTVGGYAVYRNQEDDDGRTLEVTAADVFVRWRRELDEEGTAVTLAFEGVMTVGESNRAKLERARGGMDVLGFGALLRADFEIPAAGLFPRLEVGFASGDNDRGDDVNRAFSFDPDHRVGLLLFHEVLARMSARAADRAADPELGAEPPEGIPWVPTNGSVTNAFYLYPTVVYRPLHWLDLRLGFLWALAPADVVDPYSAAKAGGFNRNYLGGEGGSGETLGYEIDAGASLIWDIPGLFAVHVVVEGAVLIPGPALDGGPEELGTVFAGRGGLDILW